MRYFKDDSVQAEAWRYIDEYQGSADEGTEEITDDFVATAAAWGAVEGYNEHVKNNGEVSKEEEEELLRAFASAQVSNWMEIYEWDWLDREKTIEEAGRQAVNALDDNN